MHSRVQQFLQQYGVAKGPLLLGYSGGVDSTALLSLLQRCGIEIHVVHVNHGWRTGSLEEASQLQKLVRSYNLPFYLETITTIDPKTERNLEDKYRKERLKIFQKYYHQIGAKALLLAHQKDDQAETVFKRIFEGASLGKLVGLKEYSEMEGMKVLRPLLRFTKDELYRYIKEQQLSFIEDVTNINVHYLRARQRVEIFPEIEKKFGKNAAHNLCRLSDNLSRYEAYMEKKIAKYTQEIVRGPLGIYLNLNKLHPLEELELEYFIRKLCEEYGCGISHDALATALHKIQEGAINKKIILQKGELIIDRGYLFFLIPTQNEGTAKHLEVSQFPYQFTYQGIEWKLEEVETLKYPVSWKQLWTGIVEFLGSDNAITIKTPDLSYCVHQKSLKEVYSEQKIPSFLRERFPHLFQGEVLQAALLIPIQHQNIKAPKVFRLSFSAPR